MPARTGQDYLEGLKRQPPTVYIDGERVSDPTTHPSTRNIARSIAHLYDLQHKPELREVMTYPSPLTGERVGTSFKVPKTKEDLRARAEMHRVWAEASLGFIGRAPDYMNVNLMAAAQAADYFAQNEGRFGENIRSYCEHVRENDLCLTHALTNPQVNRAKRADELGDPFTALGLVEETNEGIVVRGARMMATLPIADEILIFPSTVLKEQEELRRYALAFAVPTNAPGVSFQCREPLDLGRNHEDHPLGSRFDELDAMVYFDDVLVPWERVFLMNDVRLANRAYGSSGAVYHMAHQVVVGKIVKTEAFLGVAQAVVEMIGSAQFQHVQQKVAEIILNLEVMRALKLAAEEGAQLDQYGVMTPAAGPLNAARNLYPQLYPRMVEIIQLLSASGLMMIPTQADRKGPMGAHIDKYLQASGATAAERIKLYRLAWDMTLSGFGARQNLYEKFFFGDPVRTQCALYESYDKAPYARRVKGFLEQSDKPVPEVVSGEETVSAD